jgi:peptide/nickel transport system substrate-binding protein
LKLDPQASIAAGFLGPVKSTEASDDYTLRVNLNEPFFPILYNLSTPWMQPLEQAVVEKWGNDYGKHPIGVGPYIFKEWKTGEIITFQRNPDFNWGPAYAHQGPWFFDSLEFRIIPEYSTSIAGLEAGEIDYDPLLQAKDVKLIRDTGKFQIFEPLAQGLDPFVIFNVSQQPFDDVRVRQAFNLAVDRDTMIQIVTQGNAVPQYGPLSPTQHGYWPGVEQIGYHFNLDQAKSLLAEAGYKPGSDGILVKDGKPLKLVLKTVNIDRYIKTCEVLQEQLKTLGVDLQILQQEQGVNDQDLIGGNYQMIMIQSNYAEADQMYFILSTTSFNIGKVQDPVLQDLLNKTRSTTDPDQRQEWVNKAQQRIIEQAYWLLLYIPKNFLPLNTRIKGAVFAAATGDIRFDDAYITASP